MKKNYPNKMMTTEKSETKSLPKALRCISAEEQIVFGFGHFKNGDKVTDPAAIAYLAGGEYPNPNFVTEE
jgi:hypothetical protein